MSIFWLVIKTPPNAEIGSPANAFSHALKTSLSIAIPHALLCFKIANVGSLQSLIKLIAASMSNKLL